MSSKHTPGPWRVWNINDVFTMDRDGDPTNGYHIADCMVDNATIDEREMSLSEQRANAYLIAAAPEMLEALEEWLHDFGSTNEISIKTRELIAKARAEKEQSSAEKVCKWRTHRVKTHLGGTRFIHIDCKGNTKEYVSRYCPHCGGKVELEKESDR